MDRRNDLPAPAEQQPPPLHTPLVWIGGGALLMATMWLGSLIALFRGFFSLFH